MRKYIVAEGAFNEEQKYLLQNGGDGTIVTAMKGSLQNLISPVPDANLGAHHSEMLQISRGDFDNVAGVTPEQRGVAQSATATQSNIIDERASIRDKHDQAVVANFMCRIAKELLLQAKEKITTDFVIRIKSDVEINPETPIAEMQHLGEQWRVISTDALGNEDMEVILQLDSVSPVANQREKEAMMEFLAILDNYRWVSLSPVMVREVANKVNFTNEKFIVTAQQMALLQLTATRTQLEIANAQMQQQAAQVQLDQNENALAQREAAQNTPNTQEQIRNQVANQSVQ